MNLNQSNYGVTEVFVKHDYFAKLRIKLIKESADGKLTLLKDEGHKLIEIHEITTTKKIYVAEKGFLSAELDFELKYIYEDGQYSIPRYKYIIHKGSSRSSKSWSLEEWCVRECETVNNLRINVWRDTRTSLGDTIWKDFRKLFPLSGRSYKFTRNTVPLHFDKTNSTIEPHGADVTNAHGITQDIAWLNEPYLIPKDTFDQIDMRSEQVILDLNPKASHWSDKVSKHPRCKVIHSTFMENPFCPPGQKAKILSYDPDNPVNVANGTADEYMHQVYGLGLKAEKPNKIYKGWKEISRVDFDKLPYNSYYGLDFGETNATALVECKYNDGNFYFCEHIYKPGKQIESLIVEIERLGINKDTDIIVCDSASPEKIQELRMAGFYAVPASKGSGSVVAGISFLNKANVYLTTDSENSWNEYELYEWEVDRYGEPTDKTIKKDDHAKDAERYVANYLKRHLDIQL